MSAAPSDHNNFKDDDEKEDDGMRIISNCAAQL
jgi:hypothetical protein